MKNETTTKAGYESKRVELDIFLELTDRDTTVEFSIFQSIGNYAQQFAEAEFAKLYATGSSSGEGKYSNGTVVAYLMHNSNLAQMTKEFLDPDTSWVASLEEDVIETGARIHVLDEIGRSYPWLQDSCARQSIALMNLLDK